LPVAQLQRGLGWLMYGGFGDQSGVMQREIADQQTLVDGIGNECDGVTLL
jgi:hypothetical protein